MKNSLLISTIGFWAIFCVLPGCAPKDYLKSADLDVKKIIADREKPTIGYEPQVRNEGKVEAAPASAAYEKIPLTPIAPPCVAPIQPSYLRDCYGQLGPDPRDINREIKLSGSQRFGVQAAAERSAARLRLGPPAPGAPPMRLDLFNAIAYAVGHSRAYEDQMDQVYIAALNVTLQRHLFEPSAFAGTTLRYDGGNKDVTLRSALTATATLGVKQQLPFGGQVMAKVLTTFVDTLQGKVTNGESAQAVLSGSVPLLRGFGMVNLEPLISSERGMVYQLRAFENYRRAFAVDISSQYFTLVTQLQAVYNRQLNYASLLLLTQRTQALYAAGRINYLEVQRALQAQLSAESALIDAQQTYESSVDDFKLSLGMPMETGLEIVPVAIDLAMPDVDRPDVLELAYTYRLDLKTAQDQIDDATRNVQLAENGLLPDLTLSGQVSTGNRTGTPAKSFDDRTSGYWAGLDLELPLDRVAERNIYRKALISLEGARRNYVNQREQVANDVRDAVRSIHSAELSLRVQQLGIELAQQRLDYANELLKTGAMSSRDVVEAQSSLLTAQDSYDRARSALQTQVLKYLKNAGLLRVDPQQGILGRAMDRTARQMNEPLSAR